MLEFQVSAETWKAVGKGTTDADGRIKTLMDPAAELTPGIYRLTFNVESYQHAFYPRVVVEFRVENPKEHYHIPLLLSPFGYTTYRGT
jgi:5-hydroxyisourate hydrolase